MFDVIKRSVNTNLNKPLDTLITEKSTETNGKIDSKASQTSVTSMDTKVGVTSDAAGTASAGTLFGKMNKLLTDWTTARAAKIDTIATDVTSLKTSVVNGKQAVVNAINGSLGYASGLTTNHPFSDYAWWIQNKVALTNEKAFIRMMTPFAAGMFATDTTTLIKYHTSLTIDHVLEHTGSTGKQYMGSAVNLPEVGRYLLIDAMNMPYKSPNLVSTGDFQILSAVQYYYMEGRYYYGILAKVTATGRWYGSGSSTGSDRLQSVYVLSDQSIAWLNGKID